jgi:hypothetical protein
MANSRPAVCEIAFHGPFSAIRFSTLLGAGSIALFSVPPTAALPIHEELQARPEFSIFTNALRKSGLGTAFSSRHLSPAGFSEC